MAKRCFGLLVVAAALSGCGVAQNGFKQVGDRVRAADGAPLTIRALHGSVVRMGSLGAEPLLGVRLQASVCARTIAEAARIVPTSFRVAHYVTARRSAAGWTKPFRIIDNDLYWVVTLGEAGGVRHDVEFEDFIPASNYGSAHSPLGVLGYSQKFRCYGIQLTLRAVLESTDHKTSQPISASRRVTMQCGRFHVG